MKNAKVDNMKLSMKTKLAYAFVGIGDGALYNIIGVFLLFFLTTVVGISPGAAGTIAALGAVWETICAPLVGYVSDRTESKYGKRKPFLLLAAFPLAVVTSLLFTSIDATYGVKLFYYGLMTILFWCGFATFFVPYLTWGAELTRDYNERTVLRSYTYVCNTAGMVLGSVLPTIIVDYLMNIGQTVESSWQLIGMMVGGCSFVSILLGALIVRDSQELEYRKNGFERKKIAKKSFSFVFIRKIAMEYVEVLHLRAVRLLIFSSVFFLIGYSIFTANRMYFLTFNLNLSPKLISFVMIIITIAGVVFTPAIAGLSNRYEKKSVFIGGILLCIFSMVLYRIIGIHTFFQVCVYSVAISLGNTCYWQLMPSMIYDVCEVDQLAYDKKRAGVVISLQALAESISQGMGMQILGLVLEATGFEGEAPSQSTSALLGVENSFTVLPAAFFFLALIMVALYPVTRQKFSRILDVLRDREKGEEINLEEFKKMI